MIRRRRILCVLRQFSALVRLRAVTGPHCRLVDVFLRRPWQGARYSQSVEEKVKESEEGGVIDNAIPLGLAEIRLLTIQGEEGDTAFL
ncbi:hypothetical protein C8233_00665 [Halomonas sp. SF2003]|nr:hypothetical protein C8233_00665 [Halomonas sp. SF2003]